MNLHLHKEAFHIAWPTVSIATPHQTAYTGHMNVENEHWLSIGKTKKLRRGWRDHGSLFSLVKNWAPRVLP